VEIEPAGKNLDPMLPFDEALRILAEIIARKHLITHISSPGTPRQNNAGTENPTNNHENNAF
jgi:hypothetical protein